jgi:arylsulfatase A-like enzyme
MSRQELRNVLIAWGPSFKRRCTVLAPSGNTDLAPTVLRILGIDNPVPMDGRVLEEALAGGPRVDRVDGSSELYNAERRSGPRVYRQQIKLSLVGDTVYVDEGSSTLGWR